MQSPDVDRVVIHQFDPATPSPGGIDTCLRGIAQYAPDDLDIAFVGVDASQAGIPGRRLGQWETHVFGGRTIAFLPVARLDPANQRRLIPHSVRLMAGVLRFRTRIPRSQIVQAHRMDTAWTILSIFRRPLAYFVHTQENGLVGSTSDSFWRRFGSMHQRMERSVVRRASEVVVFNEPYADVVARWNPVARFSPTWFDPAITRPATDRDPHRVIWVGRLEVPKDPLLAIAAFARLCERSPNSTWSLQILGSGTLFAQVRAAIAALPPTVASRIEAPGRVAPSEVADRMGRSGVFLMTSHEGYEGYPRVLVEALASGLPSVVTEGSDTGRLVEDPAIGETTDRDPDEIAAAIERAATLKREAVIARVAMLSAPIIVAEILKIGAQD